MKKMTKLLMLLLLPLLLITTAVSAAWLFYVVPPSGYVEVVDHPNATKQTEDWLALANSMESQGLGVVQARVFKNEQTGVETTC